MLHEKQIEMDHLSNIIRTVSGPVPPWAIAVPSVLGFLVIILLLILGFIYYRRRQRNKKPGNKR